MGDFDNELDLSAINELPQRLDDSDTNPFTDSDDGFNNLDDQENYAKALAALLNYLAEQNPFVTDGKGNVAMTIPYYSTEDDVPDGDLSANLESGERGLVNIDGSLYEVT